MAEPPETQRFPPPQGLSERGSLLWVQLKASTIADADLRLLLEEACRVADRLEQLNDIIAGKGVLKLMHFRHMLDTGDEDNRHLVMTVDGVLAEARQQQVTLQRLIAAIAPRLSAAGGATQGGSILDELARRREAGGRPEAPRRADPRGG